MMDVMDAENENTTGFGMPPCLSLTVRGRCGCGYGHLQVMTVLAERQVHVYAWYAFIVYTFVCPIIIVFGCVGYVLLFFQVSYKSPY